MAAAVANFTPWMDWVRKHLWRFADHPDFEDLLQEASLAVWRVVERYPEESAEELQPLAMTVAKRRAARFLQSPQNTARRYNQYGGSVQQPVSLDELDTTPGREWLLHRTEPDFAPRLIERLSMLEAFENLPRRQRQVVVWKLLGEETFEEIGQRLGMCRANAGRIYIDALGSLRRQLGITAVAPHYQGINRVDRKEKEAVWRTRIKIDGATINLGYHTDAEEAALVYDAAVLYYLQGEGHLNLLPDEYRAKAKEES